jgi:methionyl-tRNA formyltransferase
MRIAVLFNDRLALPAVQHLAQSRMITALATSDTSPEMIAYAQMATQQAHIPSEIFSRNNFEQQITAWIEKHQPDVVLVKTFPFRIPANVLALPKYGFINFHYAPLPQFRGSNPLFWMIRNREAQAGIAVHRMEEKIDAGPLLLQQFVPLASTDTFGMLCSRLGFLGANMCVELIQKLNAGTLVPQPQDAAKAKWYGRPAQNDLLIRWKAMGQSEVIALIKASNPWNRGAAVRLRGWLFAITDALPVDDAVPAGTTPGTVLQIGNGMTIACADNKAIRATVVYTEEGFFEAGQLAAFGLTSGAVLDE